MSEKQLPRTDSIQGLASFWDTHDLTDFEQQIEEVGEPVFERETPIRLFLPTSEAAAVHELATSHAIADAELIRRWVLEKVREP
jgi:hypothetical protein